MSRKVVKSIEMGNERVFPWRIPMINGFNQVVMQVRGSGEEAPMETFLDRC